MKEAEELLKWFDGLTTRILDLVGDYAGDELFLIEGDSLLLQCFSDENLDFSHGLQLLHITYLVEKLLSQLKQRKCVFHVVFFSNHAQICIPPNIDERLQPKYRLAREAILQHLAQNLPASVPSIEIHFFDDYRCGSFEKYLHTVGAYFLMCHDGTNPRNIQGFAELSEDSDTEQSDDDYLEVSDQDEYSNSPLSRDWPGKTMLRSMMRWFICHGYNISILNSLECRNSKVMSTILEGSVSRDRNICESITYHSTSPDPSSFSPTNIDDQVPNNISAMVKQREVELTQSEWVTVIALGMMRLELSPSDYGIVEACALLLHTAILSECRLVERAVVQKRSHAGEAFLEQYANAVVNVLTSRFWNEFITQIPGPCDLGDVVDGNLFLETLSVLKRTKSIDSFGLAALKKFELLRMVLSDMFDINILSAVGSAASGVYGCDPPSPRSVKVVGALREKATDVLPFSNPIVDAHLKPVSIITRDCTEATVSSTTSRIFQELSHWHNHKGLLNAQLKPQLTARQTFITRRYQFFMKDVRRYAASLTNAVGGSLKPETVCVKPRETEVPKNLKSSKGRENSTSKLGINRGPQSSGRKIGGKHVIRDQIATQQQWKHDEIAERHLSAWQSIIEIFDSELDYSTRYIQVRQYLERLPSDKRSAVEVEVLAYMTSTLVLMWKGKCNGRCRDSSMPLVALIWHTIQQIAKAKHGVTEEIAQCIQTTLKALKLPDLELPRHGKRRMTFNFAVLDMNIANISVGLSPPDFQLFYAGPYIDRSMGSTRDPRIHDFEPDMWQREVLDQIDARGSLFVVAPTSAGKTFISFYAIKQILEDDNDGILVYVAPTKALVNQVAAEIEARFSKSFNNMPGKSVWAIHTRDYRINNPTGCQVLITVPHILQIMLLAPSNAKSWSPRIKRIIFDEVHCIGQAEDGVIWEQLLLLAPCPIIALSATVGNPEEFRQWLEMAQKANGLDLRMIQHKTRYSDLRKFIYNPPNKFLFNGLSTPPKLSAPGLDESPSMAFLHPIASLIDRSRGLPEDLSLEPRDCLMLWKVMKKHATDTFPIDDLLDPTTALPEIIKKADVIEWETKLKAVVTDWMSHDNSPFEAVVLELSKTLSTANPELQVSGEFHGSLTPAVIEKSNICDTTLPLICSLHDQDALPALFFNYDRENCERICDHLLNQLEESEKRWKETSPEWHKKLTKFEKWQKAREKQVLLVKEPKSKYRRRAGGDNQRISKSELMREMASKESSHFESFNSEDPIRGFHFADEMKLTSSEFENYATELRIFEVPERLISALKRGIGVHHAGMNRRYRQVCEILFRKGYLRVVIATGTLALGVNMPCKTVVFSGDSVYLTALNFRQAAGRAGRRGFDFLGNVVFQGLSYQKVCRLLSSRLPDLNGHFPITTSLVLRLFILLHESNQASYAIKAVNSILSCPMVYLGGPESKHTVLHHLRFSIEYLRRNWLLDRQGRALNFAGMVAHLYYTENSSFAFHALLSNGYFHRLCKNIDRSPNETLRTLMLVLSHVFGRRSLPTSVLESWEAREKSTSVVILPQLPRSAAAILNSHNEKTLSVYSAYVTTFIEQHIHDSDSTLPLTGTKCGGNEPAKEVSTLMSFLEPTQVTSSFIALSGHRDEWNSIRDLCNKVRSGVWLEKSAIPHVQVAPENGQAPLNAYLYDFFKHGNVHALVNENKIRRGDLWSFLNDFSLVLATIVTTLENFMKLSPRIDVDMLETLGSGDRLEEEMDENALGSVENQLTSMNLPPSKEKQPVKPVAIRLAKTKANVLENWDDDLIDDEEDNRVSQTGDSGFTQYHGSADPFLTPDTDVVLSSQGLLQVLQAFKMLQVEFNEKFKAMWA
ncbi:DEAD/DEAH box helicase, putative [Talaromyces stipitatus ATCC 10500]|uniref:DEAD/DEAH box helicase, putative n=1 Tax=Talaromyces stipitatus (strain ATCC 10500 / CBS 375.48 / QM 6759 / NRRL 1006) TaxID=441959 RepID=B8MUU2_TALSN|nr:DEAD/DEAH box helicase, putative [Talaromyces stipitatus ATCC 10500]EED11862.1 DEAD/DEAH box helicase, putative [Talaromyces stipitatus ATCC 10500]